MSKDNKAQALRQTGSLSDRLDELKKTPDAGHGSSSPSAGASPPPLPSPTSAAKSAQKSTERPTQSREKNKSDEKLGAPPPIPTTARAAPKAPKDRIAPAEGLENKPSPFDSRPAESEGHEEDVPAGIRPDTQEQTRRAAQRRPAGPSRERIAANDDAPSIGGLIYALNQRPSNKPFAYAAGATGLWGSIALGFTWAFMISKIDWSSGLTTITTHPSFLTAVATLIGPIVLFWFLAYLFWRTEELHLRSSAMTEVAVRLAEPDRMAEQSVASLGQAVRRQVSFMNDAVTRALGRAGELEALVHNEVSTLEQSYEDNERKIRGLIQELAGERHALLNTGDRFKDTLLQLGAEVPQLIEKLSNQQLKLAQIIEHAGTNLTELESAIGGQTHKLESALGENTGKLQTVLEDYTGALATALSSRTDEMQTMLTGYTEALGGALGSRTQQMQHLLEDNRKAIDTSLGQVGETLSERTETMQVVFEEYARALDSTLANRTEVFDMQLVERTKALDDAFGERLRLFDEAIMRSTLSIDQSVGDNAKALTSALEHHAESFGDTLSQQAVQLDETLVRGIESVRSTSENISRQSIKAIEGLAGQSDMLRNVSENLLNQISSVSNRFESQGHAIMRSANALESANYRIDQMLADRSTELNTTLDRMSSKADDLSVAFTGYTENLEGSITHAQERAKLLTQDLTRETEERARATVDDLQRIKTEASREADRALDDLRSEFANVSQEVTQRLGSLSDQFSQTTGEVRERASRAAQELEDEQGRLKQQLDMLPQATEENARAMRKALQDQLKALDQLSALAHRTASEASVAPPSSNRAIPLQEIETPRQEPAPKRHASRPLTSLTSTLARELSQRQARTQPGVVQAPVEQRTSSSQAQPHTQAPTQTRPQPQPRQHGTAALRQAGPVTQPPAPATGAAPATGNRSGNWSFGDLLARVSDEDGTDTQQFDGPEQEPIEQSTTTSRERAGGGIDIASIARALDTSTAAAIWSRFRNGQRGFMVRSIYAPEARQLFDDVVYRYQNQPGFHENVDRFVQEFERTLRGKRSARSQWRSNTSTNRVRSWSGVSVVRSCFAAPCLGTGRLSGAVHIADCRAETWPLAQEFRISRGSKSSATVVVVEASDGQFTGRGECTPYGRYGETVSSVLQALEEFDGPIERTTLGTKLGPGAARNALDCALWDLEAKRDGTRAWALAGLQMPEACHTYYTLSLASPKEMADQAAALPMLRRFKLKLGAPDDDQRMLLVRRARPDAELVVDANEGWAPEDVESLLGVAQSAEVGLVEQPLPAENDQLLAEIEHTVAICADESAAPGQTLRTLCNRYDAVNIKLDKAGGLTYALELVDEAEDAGLSVFVGSMVATSLGIAPALLLAARARWVDLDSPMLLAHDRDNGLRAHDGLLARPDRELWG